MREPVVAGAFDDQAEVGSNQLEDRLLAGRFPGGLPFGVFQAGVVLLEQANHFLAGDLRYLAELLDVLLLSLMIEGGGLRQLAQLGDQEDGGA